MFIRFLCFVKIAFTWLKPASVMYEVGNAMKSGLAAALRLGYLLSVLILLQCLVRFLLLNNALASRSTCILIRASSKSDSQLLLSIFKWNSIIKWSNKPFMHIV